MIIGFKDRFKDAILSGSKKHTIREDKSNRWRPGCLMHMATGIRTKQYNCFCHKKCISTQKIQIIYGYNAVAVTIDDVFVGTAYYSDIGDIKRYWGNLETLARNDGFDSVSDFFKWFSKDFSGKIIHWTDLRY